MKTYVPFFRGKQYEMMALRDLAERIAEGGNIIPIIEPIKANPTTRISIDKYIDVSMPFMFICNPSYGDFVRRTEDLYSDIIAQMLIEYDNWTPALQVRQDSTGNELSSFLDRYDQYEVSIIYQGLPSNRTARSLLANDSITRHVFLGDRVQTDYVSGINAENKVLISDPFIRRKNADYPPREFFTDMNTRTGNPDGVDFGDFSIAGNYFAEGGGAAFAVTLHHVHFQAASGPLDISHFISDRTETSTDPGGKTQEALVKLVRAIDNGLSPSNTGTCEEYREIAEAQVFRGLGYMKKLALKHHLEVMLDGGIQL